jgi:hypothetical protein
MYRSHLMEISTDCLLVGLGPRVLRTPGSRWHGGGVALAAVLRPVRGGLNRAG